MQKLSFILSKADQSERTNSGGGKASGNGQTQKAKVKSVKTILFKGGEHPLSNLFKLETPIVFRGISFDTVENAYQWAKATEHGEFYLAEQIKNKTAKKAMFMGKKIKTSEKWEKSKVHLMTKLVLLKKESCKEYRDFLLSSTTAILVENTYHPFWGKGENNKGKNMLGVIHTEIRENMFQAMRR